jgi:hypothetical protein
MDPHERAAIERGVARLVARLRVLARDDPSVTDRSAQSCAVQAVMGELLRSIEFDCFPS